MLKEKNEMKYLVIFFACLLLISPYVSAVNEGVNIDNVLIKLSLRQGESADKVITLTATEDSTFNIALENLKGVTISDKRFSLNNRDSKNVNVHFDSSSLKPGIYIGSVVIVDQKETNVLPVIFEVESDDSLFDTNVDVPPQYKDIEAGEKLISQVKVFDLTSGGTSNGQGPTRVSLEYTIYSLDGKVISRQTEDAVVSIQTQFTKTFSFPEDIAPGDYVLAAIVKKDNSYGVASSLFSIHESSGGLALDFGSSSTTYLIIGILVFFVFFILLFIYFVRDRDKMLMALKDYHDDEMDKMRHFLAAQEKLLQEKNKARGNNLEVHEEIRHKLDNLKKKHLEQEKHLESLKSKGDFREMRRKLAEWKSKGYNTMAMEYKLKGLNEGDMHSLLSYWKKNYTSKSIKTNKDSKDKR